MTLTLHAGTNKTGTTSLQMTLAQSRDHLRASGYLYPSLTEGQPFNHHGLIYALRRSRRDFDAMLDTFAATKAHLILSTEVVETLTLAHKRTLVEALRSHGHQVRVLIYVRHPVDWVVSNTQQAIKMRKRTYEECCLQPKLYTFRRELEHWREVVGRDAMTVRQFSRATLVGGDVVDDVLEQVGAPHLVAGITRVQANESISAASARALSEVAKIARTEAVPAGISLGPMLTLGGPKFRLPDWTIGYVQAGMQADIDWLAGEWGVAFDNAPRLSLEPDVLAETFARTLFGLHRSIATLKDEAAIAEGEPAQAGRPVGRR